MSPEIIAGTFSIIGAFAGAIIGHWTASRVNKIAARNEAANNIRSAFLPLIAKINTYGFSSESEFRNAVEGSFLTHAIEIEKFRPFVSCKDRSAYDKAYDEYKYMVSMRPLNFGHNDTTPESFFIGKVNKILHFANPR